MSQQSLSDLSSEYSSEEFEKIESSYLYDQLQDLFYDGRDDNETIINTVFDFVRSNPEKYRFDINWWSVINDLKPQYELENEKDFILIKEEVYDTILGYSSVLEYYNTDDELKKYEEFDNFNYIVNREAMRLYRDSKQQAKLRRTCRLFNNVCLSYDINEVKHGFYEFVNEWKVLIYRFKLTKNKKHVWINLEDRAEKRELMRDKEVNYYCRGVNQNVYLYICELAKVEELHMKCCDL
ncbi:11292_t:CDS:2, partial [Scutellospora calospora]